MRPNLRRASLELVIPFLAMWNVMAFDRWADQGRAMLWQAPIIVVVALSVVGYSEGSTSGVVGALLIGASFVCWRFVVAKRAHRPRTIVK